MQILLVAATEAEIAPFLERNSTMDFLITGVGSPATVYHLTKRIQQVDYDLIIQAGIAGCFKQDYNLADVLLVEDDLFADLGISEKGNFYSLFETGLANGNMFPYVNGSLINGYASTIGSALPLVRAVTVNTVTDDEILIRSLASKFDPCLESMEGAALHYVCLQEKIPFIQVRAVSNYIGQRDKSKWKMKEAIGNLHTALENLVTLCKKNMPRPGN